MNTQRRSVNLVPGMSTPAVLHASEGDVGRVLEIVIIDGQLVYNIPSTATVTITATKPSGMGFTQACTVTENGTATFETTASMTDESGMMQAEVRIVDGGQNIGTANLLWVVERNPHPSNVIDGDVERAKTILERAEEAMTKAEQMIEEVEIYNSIVEEVENTRVGVDGKTYDSAGEAVRGQVSDLKSDSVPIMGIANPTDYGKLISHITKSGRYQIQGTWSDYPDGATAGTLIVYQYGTSYVLQVFYAYLGDVKTAHYRIVHRTNYTNYINWTSLSLMWKKNLTATDNLNSITDEGVYRWPNVASTPINAPFRLNAFLLVLSNLPKTNCVQICLSSILDSAGNIAIRASQSSNTVWTPWIFPNFSTEPINNDSVYRYRKVLTSDDDLDSLTNNGTYWYSDPNIPSNAPDIPYGGVINVFGSGSSTSQKCQIYTGYGVAPNDYQPQRNQMAYRVLSGSVWSDWFYLKTATAPDNYNAFKRKRLSILGDSISTFSGYVPTGDGYATYYTGSNCGVSSVDQTWWMRLINKTGMRLCKNNSVSGSCMSTGARQDRISGCLAERTGALSDGDGNTPDYIIVYMGMNDFVNNVTIGTYDGYGNIPTDMTIFRNAYSKALLDIMTNYPDAKIYLCTTHHTEYSTNTQKIQIKGSNITQEKFNEQIREIARMFCLEVIDFEKCGITTGNIESCTGDNINAGGNLGRGLHPNAEGHRLLYQEALKHFS